jgi:hypothetical protein
MEILYISEISQLDYIINNKPSLLDQKKLMTGDMVVAFELEKKAINFIDEWDFIKPEEFENNWDLAHKLSNTWWHDKVLSPIYHGFSLCETTQQDMIYPLTACLNARTIYSRIFNEFTIKRIDGYFLPNTAVIRTGPSPTCRSVTSITQSILFYMAEQREIPLIKLESKFPLTKGQMKIKKNIFNSLHALLNRPVVKIDNECEVCKNWDKIVIVYEALIPTKEYSALLDVLKQLPRVKTIRISMQILAEGLRNNDQNREIDQEIELFWNEFNNINKKSNDLYPEIFFNKHLIFQFERIKKEMLNAASYGSVFEKFLVLLNPALVIFGHEAFTVERTLVGIARSKNIPTLSLVHTGLGPISAYRGVPGDADWLMVWNKTDIEALSYYGINKNKLFNIGCIRYEKDYKDYSQIFDIKTSQIKIEAKKKLGFNHQKPLITLLTTAINTGFASSFGNAQKHRQTIRQIIELINSRKDLQFTIKAHPSSDYYELYRRLVKSNQHGNLTFLEGNDLENVLKASDVCLMINYCTTAGLEAMLKKVPLVYLNTAVYSLLDWRDNLSESGVHRIYSINEFYKTINEILLHSEKVNNLQMNSDRQLFETLINNDNLPSKRLYGIINQILNKNPLSSNTSLLQSDSFKEFIYNNNLEICIGTSLYSIKNTHRNIIISYISGYNNLGSDYFNIMLPFTHNTIGKIKDIFSIYKNHGLISSYISGRLQNWSNGQSKIKDLIIVLPYLIFPYDFIKLNKNEKINILKFIFQTTHELYYQKIKGRISVQ